MEETLNDARGAVEPVRETETTRALSALRATVIETQDLFSSLESQMVSVLRNEPRPSDKTLTERETFSSPLAEEISSVVGTVANLAENIKEVRSRLEL